MISKTKASNGIPQLVLTRHTGLLIFWQQSEMTFKGSPEALISKVHQVTLKNLLFGWWSPMSLVINPVVTIVNYYNFYRYKKEFYEYASDPRKYIQLHSQREAAELRRSKRRGNIALSLIGGALLLLILPFLYIILFTS